MKLNLDNHQAPFSTSFFSQGQNQSQLSDSNQTKHLFRKDESNSKFSESKPISVQECAELIKNKQKIIILTGMGISVASGIPVVRGEGRIENFKNDDREYTHEEMGMYEFYSNNKEIGWEYLLSVYSLMENKEPNISHLKIQEFINSVKSVEGNSKEVVLVTQNVDGLHVSAYRKFNQSNLEFIDQSKKDTFGYCPGVFEIHGNKNYIRCDNKDCIEYQNKCLQPFPTTFSSYQDLKCRSCNQIARSHALYYDENQEDDYYRIKELNEISSGRDLIICIGTTLETLYAYWLINDAIENSIPIIEVNLYPVIEIGGLTLQGKAEEIIPPLIDEILKLTIEN